MAADLNNDTTVELDTLFGTLDNFLSDSDCITCTECRELLAGCKCFFSNFNQIHIVDLIKFVLSVILNVAKHLFLAIG